MQIEPKDVLIIVDVQRDFCAGGALAVNDGEDVVPLINALVPKFDIVVFTRDWHPANHCSFAEEPQFIDGSWPAHCIADTPGAEFHPDLIVPDDVLIVSKATDPDKEAYSDFEDTDLGDELARRGVKRVFVCGIATDYCVKATVLDAVAEGFEVFVIEDACRGVDIPEASHWIPSRPTAPTPWA